MAQITDILSTLDDLLRPGDFDDLGPNGLQVPGAQALADLLTRIAA